MIRVLGFTGTSPTIFALIITLSGGTALAQEITAVSLAAP
jgi:hypothetical protein